MEKFILVFNKKYEKNTEIIKKYLNKLEEEEEKKKSTSFKSKYIKYKLKYIELKRNNKITINI